VRSTRTISRDREITAQVSHGMDGKTTNSRAIHRRVQKTRARVTRRIENPAFRSPNNRSPTRLAEGTKYSRSIVRSRLRGGGFSRGGSLGDGKGTRTSRKRSLDRLAFGRRNFETGSENRRKWPDFFHGRRIRGRRVERQIEFGRSFCRPARFNSRQTPKWAALPLPLKWVGKGEGRKFRWADMRN